MNRLIGMLLLLTGSTCSGAICSWYGGELAGEFTANGERFNPKAMTCASWFHPFGTWLKVSHNGRTVVCRVTDRGPRWDLVRKGRRIDLSRAAFARLANPDVGLIRVTIKEMNYD